MGASPNSKGKLTLSLLGAAVTTISRLKHDDALAETVNGLYKPELVHDFGAMVERQSFRGGHGGLGLVWNKTRPVQLVRPCGCRPGTDRLLGPRCRGGGGNARSRNRSVTVYLPGVRCARCPPGGLVPPAPTAAAKRSGGAATIRPSTLADRPAARASHKHGTVYECPQCEARLVGEQHCESAGPSCAVRRGGGYSACCG